MIKESLWREGKGRQETSEQSPGGGWQEAAGLKQRSGALASALAVARGPAREPVGPGLPRLAPRCLPGSRTSVSPNPAHVLTATTPGGRPLVRMISAFFLDSSSLSPPVLLGRAWTDKTHRNNPALSYPPRRPGLPTCRPRHRSGRDDLCSPWQQGGVE